VRPCAPSAWHQGKNGVTEAKDANGSDLFVFLFLQMAVISSLPQPLVAVPAYLFVEWFTFLLPIGLGCAAGTMIWMVFAELIPDGLVFYLLRLLCLLSPLPVAAWVATFALFARCVPARPKDQGLAPLRACPCASTSFSLLFCARPCPPSPPCPSPLPRPSTSRLRILSFFCRYEYCTSATHTIRHRASTRISLHGDCSR